MNRSIVNLFAVASFVVAMLFDSVGSLSVSPRVRAGTVRLSMASNTAENTEFIGSVLGKEIAFDEATGRFFETRQEGKADRNLSFASSVEDSPAAARMPSRNKKQASPEKYKNAPTQFLSNFMQNDAMKEDKPIKQEAVAGSAKALDTGSSSIDFNAPKISKLPLETLAQALDVELYEKEWFVTGQVNPIYFSDAFEFQDPDVSLSGIEEYSKGVRKLFDQKTSRAEIISTVVNPNIPNTITCTWRLSGKVNIGPGLTIKPYLVYTDFTVDEATGLVTFQEDRFDLPQWDILVSALFPFAIGKVTKEAAPPVSPRTPPTLPPQLTNNKSPLPQMSSPFDAFQNIFKGLQK